MEWAVLGWVAFRNLFPKPVRITFCFIAGIVSAAAIMSLFLNIGDWVNTHDPDAVRTLGVVAFYMIVGGAGFSVFFVIYGAVRRALGIH